MEKKYSLITGSCGFMGTHMVEILHTSGYKILATDLESSYIKDDREKGRFPSVLKNLNIEFIPADLTKKEDIINVIKGKEIEYVFHIASLFDYSAPAELLNKINIDGTKNLCEALIENGKIKKFILWGAGGIYGIPIPEFLPIDEDKHPKNPPNNYLKSKWEQEKLVIEFAQKYNFPYAVLRPTTVYGPRNVYGTFPILKGMVEGKVISIPKSFDFTVPFIHVEDVCRSALYMAKNDNCNNKSYNLVDDSNMTLLDFAKFMSEEYNKKLKLLPKIPIGLLKKLAYFGATIMELWCKCISHKKPLLEKDTICYLGCDFKYSNQRLKDIGYKFVYPSVKQGIKDTVKWYIDNKWLKVNSTGKID